MTASQTNTDQIVEQLAALEGVMRDDIKVHEGSVTTYIPTGKLDDAKKLDGFSVKVLEEYEYEYLISVEPIE